MPMSDGGDGFIECILSGLQGSSNVEKLKYEVLDPILRPRFGTYLMNRLTNTAFIEIANVSGIALLEKKERDPFVSSSVVMHYFFYAIILSFIGVVVFIQMMIVCA
jgi:glycerate kinase